MIQKDKAALLDDQDVEQISRELLSEAVHVERRARLLSMQNQVGASEITIPVFGLQGCGKSTFLNALLMPDVVLPIDARETNCVPVEIRYGDHIAMTVFFLEKERQPLVINSYTEFETFVSDVYNESNAKGVAYGLVTVNNPLIKDNVVFVDLPGVGSMTPVNVDVTMRYLQKQVSGIFVLNTYRPINRPEKVFIREALKYVSKYWYVQNRWASESDADVEDTKRHNILAIRNVIKEATGQENYEPSIYIINCKHALDSTLTNDRKKRNDSGIDAFAKEMHLFCEDWRKMMINGFGEECRAYVLLLLDKAESLVSDLAKSTTELETELANKEREIRRMIDQNESLIQETLTFCGDNELELKRWLRKAANDCISNIRSRMREIINGGVVDGLQLDQSFRGTQEKYFGDVYLDLSDEVMVFTQKLENRIDNLGIQTDAEKTESFASFKKNKAFKWEKGVGPGLSVAGGIVGYEVTAALVAAAKAGTIGGIWGGPAGVAVGIGAALAIAGIGLLIQGVKRRQRRVISIKQLEDPLREAKAILEESITEYLEDLFKGVRLKLSDFKKAQMVKYEQMREDHAKRLTRKMEGIKDNQSKYESNCSYLKEWMGE